MVRRIMRWNRTWVVLVAAGLGALNWIVDSILHVQIYHEGTLTQQLFTQEPVEILLRSSEIALLVGLGIGLQLAISKRKRLEDDLLRTDDLLRAKEEEFGVIFDEAADGILLADMESKKFHLGNKAMCRMLGYSSEEIKSLGVMDIHPEEDLPYVVDQFERQVRGEFTLSRDLPVKRKDGSVFHADVNATTIKIAEKTYLVGFFHDTTERKRLEDLLRAKEEEFRAIFDNAVDGIMLVDMASKKFHLGNKAMCSMLGYSLEEIKSLGIMDIHPEEDIPYLIEQIERQIKGESTLSRDLPVKRKDGSVFCADVNGTIIKIAEKTYLAGFFRDTTERKHANEMIEQSQRELALRNRIVSVFLTVPDEQMYGEVLDILLEAMQSEYGTFGYIDETGAQIIPSFTRGVWDKCNVRDKRVVFPRESWGNSTWARAIAEKKTVCSNEPSVTTPEGHIKITRHIALPIVHHGEVIGLIKVANKKTEYSDSDVQLLETLGKTIAPVLDARLHRDRKELERNKVEQALSRSNAELESANQKLMKLDGMKSDFVSNVSHELRTPLTAVKAYAETLLEYKSLSEEQRESFLGIILEQSDRLATLVDDLLDLSRIEAGKLKMELTPVNVNRAIATAMQSVGPGAQKKGIEISVRPSQEDGYILADENRFVQVLVNLLNNSVKFTEQGGRIDVISVPAADSAGGSVQSEAKPTYQRITISDNGIGIATEELDRVFDRFKQVTEKTTGKPMGTGLGLTICRSLVEAMGGRIWAENSGGKGSRFHFTLPLAHGPEPERNGLKTHNGQAVDELSVASHT